MAFYSKKKVKDIPASGERFFSTYSVLNQYLPMGITINKTLISALELRRLMVDLKEKRPDLSIRFRLLGEMWNVNFMRRDARIRERSDFI